MTASFWLVKNNGLCPVLIIVYSMLLKLVIVARLKTDDDVTESR